MKLSFNFEPKHLKGYLARYYRIYREGVGDTNSFFSENISNIGAEVSIIKDKRRMVVEKFVLLINEQVAANGRKR